MFDDDGDFEECDFDEGGFGYGVFEDGDFDVEVFFFICDAVTFCNFQVKLFIIEKIIIISQIVSQTKKEKETIKEISQTM